MEEDEDIYTVPLDDTVEIGGYEVEADEVICTVPLDDTVEIDGHELEDDLENAYVEDTEDQDAPDSREYLRAPVIGDHALKDIVLDSDEQEAERVGCVSTVKNMENTSNKWKLNTLVYRRKRSKIVEVGVEDAVLGSAEEIEVVDCGSASKSLEEMNNKWKLNSLVYRRRRSKNVSVCEHSILSLASAEKATSEGNHKIEKHGTVSSHASNIGIHSLDEKIRHSENKICNKDDGSLECNEKMRRHFAVDSDADRFASSHCETKHGENDVPRQICLNEFGLGSDSEEPKEPYHMNALDFVDHFLSVNNLNILENQKSDGQRGGIEKSPPEFSVKGVQSLAKRAYLAAKPRDITIFDWDEKETTECNVVKVSNEEELHVKSLQQSPEKDGSDTQIIADTCDFGYDTQVAAEAMEALMYAPLPNISVLHTQEFPRDEVGNLSEVAPKSKKCTNFEMPGSVSLINQKQVENMSTKNFNKLNQDVSCPLKMHSGYKNEYSSPLRPKNSATCREPLAANSLHYRKPMVVKKVLGGKNLRLISKQQVDENLEMENSEGAGNGCSSSKFTHSQQHIEVMIVQKFRKSSGGAKRDRCKPLERISEVSTAPSRCSKRSMNNDLELDVAKKRRMETSSDVNIHKTLERRNLNSISDESLGIMSSKRTQGRCNSGWLGTSTLLKLEPWCLKKKKRTRKGVPRLCKGSINSSTLLKVVDDEQIDKYPVEPPKCAAGPLPSSHAESLSFPQTTPSEKVPKHKIQEKSMPDPLPNFIPRQLRRRRNDTLSILFSQHLDCDILNKQKKIIARLGFSIACCCSDATHFVTDRFARTRNMLEAISLGKPVVTHCWLESCDQAKYFVDEKPFILRDSEKEKEIGFSMPVTLAHACKHPLLTGLRVFITANVKPDIEMIQSLVKLLHGKVLKRIPKTEWNGGHVPNDLLVLSCEEDYAACVTLLHKGVAIYDPELLLNGIVIQRLELKRHQLFTNNAPGSCRKRARNPLQH
ncbi:OLC1v1007505C3 [Oldenlandia corymbosa var. corymbosa]|uniref:OLC1v1007505C3 n=1 Tax=Oldenlandia corymbosa var. corymbosa TaxID=529605 RepID=A0AAV1DMS0_OLDCO|nr:OLC1v1007505C3 [Oldenlandia corymbosa var. corymbosa]